MQLLQSFICVLLLLTTGVLSVPTRIWRPPQQKTKGRSFKVERIRRANYAPNGPASLRKAYRKFGFSLSEDISLDTLDFKPKDRNNRPTASSQADDTTSDGDETGVVTAKSISDVEFVAAVKIGGQTIMMDFDTGSSDLWVFNTNLDSASQEGHTIYDPSKSANASTLQGYTFDISYGDGSGASGPVGTDTVDIGGAVVQTQAIGLPDTVSDSFVSDTDSNGLVGFAFSSLNTVQPKQQKTFFDNIADDLDEPVLTALLKSDSNSGQYELGTIDKSLFTGTMANISIDTTNGFWQFNSAQFAVGNGSLQTISSAPIAIADTGTTLMLVADEVASAYYAEVSGAQLSNAIGGYIFPCSADLPDLSIAVGDYDLATVPSSVLNFEEVGTNTTTGESVCYGGIQSNSGSELQIFGDVFLKSMFVVFDMRGPSLGLATPAA